LPKGQAGEAWKPLKSKFLPEIGKHRLEDFFSLFSHLNIILEVRMLHLTVNLIVVPAFELTVKR
jgi:hypothetical protein